MRSFTKFASRSTACKTAIIAGLIALLPGCVSSRMVDRQADCILPQAVPAVERTDQGDNAVRLSVLIYNVEGLPWPARSGRSQPLRQIGETLQALRDKGTAPDIVMLQEAFTPAARDILVQAGYSNIVSGPGRKDRREIEPARIDRAFRKARQRKKGERFGRFLNSGLYIASDLPIDEAISQPFSRRACAGFDCLANKGALVARVQVPGMPGHLEMFTTHLNSQKAARVSLDRARKAHGFQLEENALLIAQMRDPANPLILGGDFNMRGDPERFAAFAKTAPYTIVHEFCIEQPGICNVKMSFDGDEPWMDTQDLQAYDHGSAVNVTPVQIEAMFDGLNGERLSDHDGLLVVYQLRWPQTHRSAQAALPKCPRP